MCTKVRCEECQRPTWQGCGGHIGTALAGVPISDRCGHKYRTDAERWHLYLQKDNQGTQFETEMIDLEQKWNVIGPNFHYNEIQNPSRQFNPALHPQWKSGSNVQPMVVQSLGPMMSSEGLKPKPTRNLLSHGNHKNMAHHGRSSSRRSSYNRPNMFAAPVDDNQSETLSKGIFSSLSKLLLS